MSALDFVPDESEERYAREYAGRLVRLTRDARQALEKPISLKIDGQEVTVNEATAMTDAYGVILYDNDGLARIRSTTIYDAAAKLAVQQGIENPIPVLCHQQHVPPVAVCRVCSVLRVEDGKAKGKLDPACQYLATDGMEVHTCKSKVPVQVPGIRDEVPAGEYVTKTVGLLVDMLAAHHLHFDQPANDRRFHNELLAIADRFKVYVSPPAGIGSNPGQHLPLTVKYSRKQPQQAVDISSPVIAVDHNNCILCDRCVRACGEVKPFKVIGHTGHGKATRISFDLGQTVGDSGCVACGECAVACPTGAILFRGSVFQGRDPWKDYPKKPVPTTVSAEELATHDLFAGIPFAYLKWNEGAVGKLACPKGDVLCRQDDFGSTAFVIEGGAIEVLIDGKKGQLSRLRTRKDRLVGEMACLTHQPRSATLRAHVDSTVLVVRRNMLQMMLRTQATRDLLDVCYRERAIESMLHSGRLLHGLDETLGANCRSFFIQHEDDVKFFRVDRKRVIVTQEQAADCMYVIYSGNVKVAQGFGENERVLAYLGPGEHFGEIGIMSSLSREVADAAKSTGQRTATCTALDNVELLQIGRGAIGDLIKQHTEVGEYLKRVCLELIAKNAASKNVLGSMMGEFLERGLYQARDLLVIDLTKCTRCLECVQACADSHDGVSRLAFEGKVFENYLVPGACRSCHDPQCLALCPVDAIHRPGLRLKDGLSLGIHIDEDHCIGCGLCAINCPFGSVKMHPRGDKPVAKNCDLCEGKYSSPRCVHTCPHEAAIRRQSGAQFARRVDLEPLGPVN